MIVSSSDVKCFLYVDLAYPKVDATLSIGLNGLTGLSIYRCLLMVKSVQKVGADDQAHCIGALTVALRCLSSDGLGMVRISYIIVTLKTSLLLCEL